MPVLGSASLLPKLRAGRAKHAIIAIGDNRTRHRYAAIVREHDFALAGAVHPSAVVSPGATLGENVVVAAHATVCTEARVDDLAIINTAAVVDHECSVGVAAHVGPGRVAGRPRSHRRDGVHRPRREGDPMPQCRPGATIGAGAVVIDDVPDFATAVGVPARVIKLTPEAGAE